jgi:hypothetical protein
MQPHHPGCGCWQLGPQPGSMLNRMPHTLEELTELVKSAIRPTTTDLTRARQLVRARLRDGEPHNVGELRAVLLEADEVIEPSSVTGRVADQDTEESIRMNPQIVANRLALAGAWAVAEFDALGMIIPADISGQSPQPVVGKTITVRYQVRNRGGGISIDTNLPPLRATGYTLAPRLHGEAFDWWFDPEAVVADVEDLGLELRSRRALVEALSAFRYGLFLACINLLGAVSEGAWYTAGGQLAHLDERLAAAFDRDDVKKVIERTAEVLRQSSSVRPEVAGLVTQAEMLRDLRNYAAHPRDESLRHMEQYLSESAAGNIVLQTHSYLTRLARAVRRRLEKDQS